MSSVAQQRDVVVTLKKETLLNVGVLSKLHRLPPDLYKLLKENNLDKPTQNLFNHLAHYLVSIIDPQVTLPWPLYDTKTERTFRNELSVLISVYGNKGLLAPVISSYLVNPGCFKVVNLMFQMSHLAVQRVLLTKMNNDRLKKIYNETTTAYKTQNEEGIKEIIEKETNVIQSKFSNYLAKRDATEKNAKKLRDQIIKNEKKLETYKARELIDKLVDGYLQTHSLDDESRQEILEIKNIEKPSKYFDTWLQQLDREITEIENNWELKTAAFLKICQTTAQNTKTLIARQTGEADTKTFMIEYNPKVHYLNTDELEKLVNTEQKYILKNIVKEEKLYFPNLIRGFLISICFILKNAEIGDEIYKFNKYLEEGRRSYKEIASTMKILLERVMNAEGKLQQYENTHSNTISVRDIPEIPPLPDLSDLKMNKEYHHVSCPIDPFTPINFLKHEFNLNKRRSGLLMNTFPKVLVPPFQNVPKYDFFKSLISSRVSPYDNMNSTQNTVNLSVISHARSNETIAECTSGFTKQQIYRLLSTKKSSTKKLKHKTERPNINVKKGGLFNESNISNESVGVFRSHSSPNLYENREKRFHNNFRTRMLPMMKEYSPSLLEVSGIAELEKDSNHSTPQGMMPLESSRKLMDAVSLPSVILTETTPSDLSENIDVDLNKEIEFKEPQFMPRKSKEASENKPPLHQRKSKLPQPTSRNKCVNLDSQQIKNVEAFEEAVLPQRRSRELFEEQATFPQRKSVEFIEEIKEKTETPKANPSLVKKSSSLEKIINRFKKVRASMLPSEVIVESNDFKTIFEEKENLKSNNLNDIFSANRNLLPDLLSPSCSMIPPKSTNHVLDAFYFDNDDETPIKHRESLGTALGVDHTFLDQFDLID